MASGKKKETRTLKPLPGEIRSIVRSGIAINSVAQCVEELVYNAVDAGAKDIYVGINLEQFNVRVEDDGYGLTEVDLEAVGNRYTTSKCSSLADLNNLKYYGFRGEAVSSIIEVSNTVDIITRPMATAGIELKKKYENGVAKGFIEKYNTSAKKSGTTVVVGKLLSKLPVRQQRIDKTIQLEEVKGCLEKIALINPTLNVELRNEKNGTQLFTYKSSSCYSDAVNQMFMSRIGFEVKFIQEHFLHKKLFFNLSVSSDFVKKKHYQFVFLNNRFIRRGRIHKWVGNFILDRRKDSSSPESDKYPIFILNITCPFSEYDITLEPKKQVVEFKDWDTVCNGIDGLILKLKHKNTFSHLTNANASIDKNCSLISSFDVKGVVHSRFATRKAAEQEPGSKTSSFTDSDRESIGRTSFPKADTRRNNPTRNLSRSSHTTHVVNVREVRKKRKLNNATTTVTVAPAVPLKSKLNPVASKPKLTLSAFKRFPAWEDEFGPTPAKKSKETLREENYKYYRPSLKPATEKDNQTEALDNVRWKIDKYLQGQQPGSVSATNGSLSEACNDNSQSEIDRLTPPPKLVSSDSSNSKHIVPASPKSPFLPIEDPESYVFMTSGKFIRKHLEGKWTFNNTKEDIINRLLKYFQYTKKTTMKSRKNVSGTPVEGDNKPNKLATTNNATAMNPGTAESSQPIQQGPTNASNNGYTTPVNPVELSQNQRLQVYSVWKPSRPRSSSSEKVSERPETISASVNDTDFKDNPKTSQLASYSLFGNSVIPPEAVTNQIPKNICSGQPIIDASASTTFGSFKVNMSSMVETDVSIAETTSACLVDSKPVSFLQPSKLGFLNFNLGSTVEANTSFAPPLLNLFPIQKPYSCDWNDNMIMDEFKESDSELFPSDFAAEIIEDRQGQEWLQSLDSNGTSLYINLSTGESSYDVDHPHGNMRKVTAGEMRKSNPVRFNWLRRHFPRGFKQFWNGDRREITKEGDLTKLNNSVIGTSLFKHITEQTITDRFTKWTDSELQNVSKYFSDDKDCSIKTVTNVSSPGIQCWKNLGGTTSSFRFSREDFGQIRVIGQYDRKFILAAIRKSSTDCDTLVIFDQHAVHERIRLEQLIADSFENSKAATKYLRSSEVIPSYQLHLSETEVRIMKSYEEFFKQAAIKFEAFSSNAVKIKSVPKCFMEKCSNEPVASRQELFRNLVHGMIQELIHTIIETKVASLTSLPKTINNVLCSQACHGAIKFGDVLDLDTCKELIVNLRSCKNLFQCAHGRPSVVPLIKGEDMLKVSTVSINCFQDVRQPCLPSEVDSGYPSHYEYSKYFCDPGPPQETVSNYFSTLDDSVASTSVNDQMKENPISFLLPGPSGKNANESTTSDFFSFTTGEKSANNEDEGESPYFFRFH